MRIEHKSQLGVFKYLDRKLSANRGEVLKEDFQGIARFQMLEDDANGHSCPYENGRSTEDLGVRNDARGLHGWLLRGVKFTAEPPQGVFVAA
jgi:hypothetical protein